MARVRKAFYFIKTSLATKTYLKMEWEQSCNLIYMSCHLHLTIPITNSDPSWKVYQQIVTNIWVPCTVLALYNHILQKTKDVKPWSSSVSFCSQLYSMQEWWRALQCSKYGHHTTACGYWTLFCFLFLLLQSLTRSTATFKNYGMGSSKGFSGMAGYYCTP